ncbi:hypothetical protein [Aurantimonas coralicida]|uniref:hypothetical protein n=1 Tax=Aurantimonas coralicida TaxID=182270 RepID=UPI0023F026E3|nr:hypothetical protein [Aurantimonas coralicida]
MGNSHKPAEVSEALGITNWRNFVGNLRRAGYDVLPTPGWGQPISSAHAFEYRLQSFLGSYYSRALAYVVVKRIFSNIRETLGVEFEDIIEEPGHLEAFVHIKRYCVFTPDVEHLTTLFTLTDGNLEKAFSQIRKIARSPSILTKGVSKNPDLTRSFVVVDLVDHLDRLKAALAE